MNTIMESTQQECDTLKVQFEKEYQSMNGIVNLLKQQNEDELDDVLAAYEQIDSDLFLYVDNGQAFPSQKESDLVVKNFLNDSTEDKSVITPHINQATGMRVFDLYQKFLSKGGKTLYLVKEYESEKFAHDFHVPFYQNIGFSYVADAKGELLIGSAPFEKSQTEQNLFTILKNENNSSASIQKFAQDLLLLKDGWITFSYQKETTAFCYVSLGLSTDWYFISAIPKRVVMAQANEMVQKTLL